MASLSPRHGPSLKGRRLSRRTTKCLLWTLLPLAALLLHFFFRRGSGRLPQTRTPEETVTHTQGTPEDGSRLLSEQQEQHLAGGEGRQHSTDGHSTGTSSTSALAAVGVVEKPKPPGWPFDPMDYPMPRTFFDIEIDGKPAGRIVFELFTKQAPRAAENFRALCTGEKGRVPTKGGLQGSLGPRLHYKGAEFYRVIDKFICQTGIETPSIYGGMFDDDPMALDLRHDKKGLLSAANMGPNTTTTHFSIVVAPAPHLNGHYPIFGQVVEGMGVVDAINALAKPPRSKDERPRLRVLVANCGEIVCPDHNWGSKDCREVTLQERRRT